MPRVIHFEIHAEDPQRAINFYSSVFGWEFKKWGEGEFEYWLIKTGENEPGIDGGLMPRRGKIDGESVIAYVCTIDVPDFEEYKEKIESAGGINVVEKMAVPNVGWMGYYKDTEGNIFGTMQNDPLAE